MAFDVIEEDFDHFPLYCPIFPAIELVYGYGRGTKRQSDASATLDRIDNARGYVRDNVLIISWRGNRLEKQFDAGRVTTTCDILWEGFDSQHDTGLINVLSRQLVPITNPPSPPTLLA